LAKFGSGVDGGGTKTQYALFDDLGNFISFREGGPSNHEVFENGYKGTKEEFETSLKQLLQDGNLRLEDIEFGVFGLAGVDVQKQKQNLIKLITKCGIKNFLVFNDAFLGIKAASVKGYGICSINGTGTCCAGIDPQGHWLQIGGAGFIFGDEAGAAFLGGMVVRRVYDSIFRCGEPTIMKDLFFKELQITDEEQFVDAYYGRINFDQKVEDYSKILFQAANLGDRVALELLDYTGRNLAKTVIGAINRLDFSTENEIDVVMAGSVYVKGENPAMITAFQEEICAKVEKKVRFTLLQVPPVTGGVLWALEEVNKILDPKIREKVIQSLTVPRQKYYQGGN
jgi:N-acetylglucosamine kinase-like BadF-type ATPase